MTSLAVVVAVVVAVVAVLVVWPALRGRTHSSPGAATACSPRACVTDGRYILDPGNPQVASAERAIAQENAEVRAAGRPYVSVALLDPLTATATSDVSLPRIVDDLRGAYLAQAQVNAKGIVGVQLLLANEGDSTEAGEGPVVKELESLEGAPDHLVAVAGMGISTAQTEHAASSLAANSMIMIGAVTTADQLDGHDYMGFDEVSPDIDEQLSLLAKILRTGSNTVLVQDSQATDIYTGDLDADFIQIFGQNTHLHRYPYTPHTSFTDDEFQVIASNACTQEGTQPVVFYAGRVAVLSELIAKFQADRACKGEKVTIASTDDADGLDRAVTRTPSGATGAQVSVEYTDLINLDNLTGTFKAFYRNDLAALDPHSAGLSDVVTIATYNAMMTAWTAIDTAYQNSMPLLPTRQDVQGLWSLLNGKYAPVGAAGPVNLNSYGELLYPAFPVFLDSGGTRTSIKP